MSSKLWSAIFALVIVVAIVFAPAVAQKPGEGVTPAPAPHDDQMTRMMTQMRQVQEQIKQMHEQMKGMQGTNAMQGRMGRMRDAMGQMSDMIEQHRAEMQKMCPGQPRQGG
jgi:TolA-binding protein